MGWIFVSGCGDRDSRFFRALGFPKSGLKNKAVPPAEGQTVSKGHLAGACSVLDEFSLTSATGHMLEHPHGMFPSASMNTL
jgi:hypothetical protein